MPKETRTPLHLAELGGTRRWVNASNYPLVPAYTALYLAGGGKLLPSAEAAAGGDELRWVQPGRPSDSVEYVSEPYAQGAMLAGPIAARVEASSSNRNLQLVIEVLDRAPSNTLSKISHGSILGSRRRTDPERSWNDEQGLPIRPHLTLDEDQPLTAGMPTRLDVPLWPSVWSIEPGHGIVVRISTQPRSAGCGQLLGVPVGCNPTPAMVDSLAGGVYTLHRGGELRSLVSLPLLEHGALKTAQSAVSPTGKVSDSARALGGVEYPLPIEW